jgi:molybdopterin/thiamine biosynthesis adenylyltransferase
MALLSAAERATYEWQLDIPGFGEEAQAKLRASTALISRCGGLGGPLAYSLAGAGIGRLIIAHGGNLQASDLNRQVLMTHDWVGKPRIASIVRRLREYTPHVQVEGVGENITDDSAAALVGRADIVFDCAPLFEERFLMNRECVRQGKPMVEAAMFGLEGQVTSIVPGRTPCLRCLYPETPPAWKRRFPVLGAVSAMAGSIAAVEGVKLLTGLGEPLTGTLLYFDAATMVFQRIPIQRRAECPECGGVRPGAGYG